MPGEDKPRLDSGSLEGDAFEALASSGKRPVQLEMHVHYGLPYGAGGVKVVLRIECEQNEKTIDHAGETAFLKARELALDGMSFVKDDVDNGFTRGDFDGSRTAQSR